MMQLDRLTLGRMAKELFWKAFSEGSFHPEWIFGESNELVNIVKHPMALWKCRNKAED